MNRLMAYHEVMNEFMGWQWLAPWGTMEIDTTSLVEQGPSRLQVVAPQHLMGKPKMPQQLSCRGAPTPAWEDRYKTN